MKLNDFITKRKEKVDRCHLFQRCFAKDGRILVFEDEYKDKIIEEYENIGDFIKAYPDQMDIKYVTYNHIGQVFVPYGDPTKERYCPHFEKMKVWEINVDNGKESLLKRSVQIVG